MQLYGSLSILWHCLAIMVNKRVRNAVLGCYIKSDRMISVCFQGKSFNIKVILKILQTWLQQSMNHELPDVQAGFRKGRGTRDQIANIRWIIEKATKFQKYIYFCFIDYAKAFNSVDHNKLWKNIQEVVIPDRLTCLLRNLYAGQAAAVRSRHGKMD